MSAITRALRLACPEFGLQTTHKDLAEVHERRPVTVSMSPSLGITLKGLLSKLSAHHVVCSVQHNTVSVRALETQVAHRKSLSLG